MKPSTHSFHYRPDIDGLRALAVLPVLLFHAKLGCPGGFIGVDIFFVVSGFLISSLILKELGDGTFSLITFWERRIRRILPALAFVVLTALIAGWFLFLPVDFKSLGKSVIAQAALLSNVYFYLQPEGYFDAGIETKPLLHTWSLAVEEQFYLFFPLLLLYLSRCKNVQIPKTVAILAVGSFTLSVAGTYLYPSATFYFLPTRAWELFIGALLAMLVGRISARPQIREVAGWLGIAFVCFPILFYNGNIRFPGVAAIPPCLGAVLIIFSSESKLSFVGRLLAFKPVVFIGLISYSLYLWHWPLLMISQYLTGPQLWPVRASLLIASTVLAVLTWKYVETPFRKRQFLHQRRQIFGFAGISMASLLVLGFVVCHARGLPSRFSDKALGYAGSANHTAFRAGTSLEQALAGQFVELGQHVTNQTISVLIWGDSHAMGVAPVLDDLCRRFSVRGVEATQNGIPPVLKPIRLSTDDMPLTFNEAVLSFIKKKHIKNVIITAHWKFYAKSDSFNAQLISTVRAIMNTGYRVYVLKDVPDQGVNVPRIAALTVRYGGNINNLGVTKKKHVIANRAVLTVFEQISQMGATVLDPADYFLNSRGLYGAVKDNQVLYADGNHITIDGGLLLAPLFEPIFHTE